MLRRDIVEGIIIELIEKNHAKQLFSNMFHVNKLSGFSMNNIVGNNKNICIYLYKIYKQILLRNKFMGHIQGNMVNS